MTSILSAFKSKKKSSSALTVSTGDFLTALPSIGNQTTLLLVLSASSDTAAKQWDLLKSSEKELSSLQKSGKLHLLKYNHINQVDFTFKTSGDVWLEGALYKKSAYDDQRYYQVVYWDVNTAIELHERVCKLVELCWGKQIETKVYSSREHLSEATREAGFNFQSVETTLAAEHQDSGKSKAYGVFRDAIVRPTRAPKLNQKLCEEMEKDDFLRPLCERVRGIVKNGAVQYTEWESGISKFEESGSHVKLGINIKAEIAGTGGGILGNLDTTTSSTRESHVSCKVTFHERLRPQSVHYNKLIEKRKFVSRKVNDVRSSIAKCMTNRGKGFLMNNAHDMIGLIVGDVNAGKSSTIKTIRQAVNGEFGNMFNNINTAVPPGMIIRSTDRRNDGTHTKTVDRYPILTSSEYTCEKQKYQGKLWLHDTTGLRVEDMIAEPSVGMKLYEKWTEATVYITNRLSQSVLNILGTYDTVVEDYCTPFTPKLIPSFTVVVCDATEKVDTLKERLADYAQLIKEMRQSKYGIKKHPMFVLFTRNDKIDTKLRATLKNMAQNVFGDTLDDPKDVLFIRNYVMDENEMNELDTIESTIETSNDVTEIKQQADLMEKKIASCKVQNEEVIEILKYIVTRTTQYECAS